MAKAERPEATLEPRPGDIRLTSEELLKISVFQGLKAANLDKFPGAVVLRRFRPGEIVCRQGDWGFTAYYILKSADVLALSDVRPDVEPSDQIEELRNRVELIRAALQVEQELAQFDPGLVKLDIAAKRARADQVEATHPDLATNLRMAAEGDYLRSKAAVSLTLDDRPSDTGKEDGLWTRMMRGLFSVKQAPSAPQSRFIPIDGPVDLEYENPVATLFEGELFGEMSCLNLYPRSATVRAKDHCFMIEMLRNVLEPLKKSTEYGKQMDEIYRRRVLDAHLKSLPLFSRLNAKDLQDLASKVELVVKEAGEEIFKEGDESDCMYVIRVGMVKVVKKASGGDLVLAYRGRGEYIGEMGVFERAKRSATCRALDHPRPDDAKHNAGRVELVKIKADDFWELINRYPDLKEEVARIIGGRRAEEFQIKAGGFHVTGAFDELGLWQGQKLMLIDLDKCTRCDECVRACAATHADGRTRLLREGPRFGKYLVPASCRQCRDPVCLIGCPVGSIHKGKKGEIVIEKWCIGCGLCADQCPYQAINMHDLFSKAVAPEQKQGPKQLAVVCDQCQSLSDGKPSCVYACPHDAASRVDAPSFFGAQTMAGSSR